ncbi:Homeodomain-like protein [Pseudohyphozyma bogoriensis]|nr:Homeodomain-like protein [Pseudohyphozyma bogoriensis]
MDNSEAQSLSHRLSFAAGFLLATSILAPRIPLTRPPPPSSTQQRARASPSTSSTLALSSEDAAAKSTVEGSGEPSTDVTAPTSPEDASLDPKVSKLIVSHAGTEDDYDHLLSVWDGMRSQFKEAGCDEIVGNMLEGEWADVQGRIHTAHWVQECYLHAVREREKQAEEEALESDPLDLSDPVVQQRDNEPEYDDFSALEAGLVEPSDMGNYDDYDPIAELYQLEQHRYNPANEENLSPSSSDPTSSSPFRLPTPSLSREQLRPQLLFATIRRSISEPLDYYDWKAEQGSDAEEHEDEEDEEEWREAERRKAAKPFWLKERDLSRVNVNVQSPGSPTKEDEVERRRRVKGKGKAREVQWKPAGDGVGRSRRLSVVREEEGEEPMQEERPKKRGRR